MCLNLNAKLILILLVSRELFARHVVHRQVVHVCLDELQRLILNCLNGPRIQVPCKLVDLVTRQAFALFYCLFLRLLQDVVHVR